MQQRIVGFHQDEEAHWVADLQCGHTQHVRHDPPWQDRTWVLEEASRRARLGAVLNCVVCDESPPDSSAEQRQPDVIDGAPVHFSPAAAEAYWDARVQGLCHDGALEIAERIDRNGPTVQNDDRSTR